MVQELINTVFQVLAFSLIPFVAYLVRKRKLRGFLPDIGLKSAPLKALLWGGISSVIILLPPIVLALIFPEIKEAFHHPESMTGRFRAMGFGIESMSILILTAMIKTGLSEEIFFRGFVAKRLIAVMGFKWGNITQALIFGALHVVIMLKISDSTGFIILMLVLTSFAAWVIAHINEKMANGSILPGWIMHGLGNALSYSILGFIL